MSLNRQQTRRVFEDALDRMTAQHVPAADLMVDATVAAEDGTAVLVARYKILTDGRWECFQILDDVLWPSP